MLVRDTFTRKDLDALIAEADEARASIIMPTHRAGPETRQDPIRFKNLLERLERSPKGDAFATQLAGCRELLDTQDFWQHQSDALAVYLAERETTCHRIAVEVEELLVVAPRCHVAPLLSLIEGAGRFFLLAISQEQARLLRCTTQDFERVEIDLPTGPSAVGQYIDAERSLQFHTSESGAGATRASVAFHGHGGEKDKDKVRTFEYFRAVDETLERHLRGDRTPVVLACVDYLYPLFKEAVRSINLVPEHVGGNFDEIRSDDRALHQRGVELMTPRFAEARSASREQLGAAVASGRGSADLDTIVAAAREGRVERLWVDTTARAWGRIADDGTVERVDGPGSPMDLDGLGAARGDFEDLVNASVVFALQRDGAIDVVDSTDLPDGGPVAALFRY